MFGTRALSIGAEARARPARRDPRVAELMARLEVAVGQRNAPAAERIIDNLLQTEDGEWLVRQVLAAGLRQVSIGLSAPD